MSKFVEEKMIVAENDLDKIRTAPLMYISRLGSLGAVHLAKECINNNIDECINEHSPGNKINIIMNEDENSFVSEDNGRGLPFENMLEACTLIQSSTKFGRTDNQKSAGCHGAGLKCTNALSDYFKLEVYKLGEYACVEYKDGVQIQDATVTKIKNKEKHGTIVTFKPSEKYMGKCQMDSQVLLDWLNNIKHFLDQKIVINYTIIKNGETTKHKIKRTPRGLVDLVDVMSPFKHSPIYYSKDTTYIDEDVRLIRPGGKVVNKTLKRDVDLEFAFCFNMNLMEPMTRSFCNFVHTIDEGDHTQAVMNGICQFFTKKTREALSEKEKEKYNILYNDVTSSLVLVLSLSTSMDPGFTGQTKEKIENKKLMKPLTDLVKSSLENHFNNNQKELKKFTDLVKTNAKARFEANKSKSNLIKREVSLLSQHLIPNFTPANHKGKNDYTELYIYEGLSVESNGSQARDPEFQAMYVMRGVPGNAFDMSTQDLLEKNETFRNLARAINAGCGDSFDITKCRFSKVIISSDADIDGKFIFSLLGAFFLKHMPDLILDGRLYLVLPPLYKIKDKKKPFVVDKAEYNEVYYRCIMDKFEIKKSDGEPIKRKEFHEMLESHQYYLEELTACSKHCIAHPKLVEYVVKHRYDDDFNIKIKDEFPEIDVIKDDNGIDDIIIGIYENKQQIFTLDKIFDKKTNKLKEIMDENEDYYILKVEEKYKDGNENRGTMTIGEFLTLAQKVQPQKELRYKGLGELSEDDLWDTTMDPNKRTLVRLTVSDIEEAMKTYEILHSKKKDKERREMTEGFEINKDMLDN